ncbi:MAG TPA: enolase C-terminal domain-like protein [Candidatus Hydrogenedentes bacterium]|nr:enolase C-terminal domain-like protein [Candidatus Hydrogenedentota bacterium]HQH51435.1 enolase C-terminal domain-like protein [Candidatus Hydrogenedentota bacterium]
MRRIHISSLEVFAVDLPFRVSFKHSAAERTTSESVFVKCVTDQGDTGFGEALPRVYVTGESQQDTFDLLAESILPRLMDRGFSQYAEVEDFLLACDGRAPAEWVDPAIPQGAAWCAVDLALLDTFGRAFGEKPLLARAPGSIPKDLRYSAVLSAEKGLKRDAMILAFRLAGFRHIKLKVGPETTAAVMQRIRTMAGHRMDLRTDANMGWNVEEAIAQFQAFAPYGVQSHEQPVAAADLAGMARLVRETGKQVMADESFTTRDSLQRLVERRACTAVNARISKCGGLMATWQRCRGALDAGLTVQIGCQVGESSLLSAAHLRLCAAVGRVKYAEGCFGELLLREDPVSPVLRFGWGGKPPVLPAGPGLGVAIDESRLMKYVTRRHRIE